MSSQVENKNIVLIKCEPLEEDSIDFNKIIIPFSDFGASKKPSYIHDELETMKFKERHPFFQSTLLSEFGITIDETEN